MSLIIADNSSTIALNNGETFTGNWQEVQNFSSLIVAIKTDQDGTWYVDFSNDKVNADGTLPSFLYRTSEINPPHRITITRPYFRVRFVNDSGSNQTYFRLISMVGEQTPLNIPINGTISRQYDALPIRNPYDPMEIALERLEGVDGNDSPKFGYNSGLTQNNQFTLWSNASRWTRGTQDSVLTLTSSDTADTSAGTGARTVQVSGVDASTGQRASEIVTLNGTSDVDTSTTWKLGGVNRIQVLTAGSGNTNAGNITATHKLDSTVQAYVLAGKGITRQLIYTVADDEFILLDGVRFNAGKLSGGGNPRIRFKIYRYLEDSSVYHEFYDEILDTAVQNTLSYGFGRLPIKITGIDQFEVTAESDNSATAFAGGTAYYANVRKN